MKHTVQLSCLLLATCAFAHIAGAVEDLGVLVQKAVEGAIRLADPWLANGNREPDNGNQGPVRSFDGNYEYRGEPRTCINLYHGDVEPCLYVDEHTLKVNRWRRRNCGDGM